MASKKVSELSEITSFSDDAYIPVVKDGVTYKISLENLLQKTLRVDKSSEISSVAAKSISVNSDLIMVEDSAGGNAKKKCTKSQFLHDVPQVETGSADPAYTPAKKGMIYIDTGTGNIFIAADTSSSGDWKKIN